MTLNFLQEKKQWNFWENRIPTCGGLINKAYYEAERWDEVYFTINRIFSTTLTRAKLLNFSPDLNGRI